jgi:hypothetical protein
MKIYRHILSATLAIHLAFVPMVRAQSATSAAPSTPAAAKASVANTTAAVKANVTAAAGNITQDIAQSQNLVTKRADALKTALASDTASSGLLSQAMSALSAGKDIPFLQSLTQLYNAKLTPAQLKLVGQLRDESAALLLQRSVAAPTPALAGPVHDTVAALRAGNYSTALQQLTGLASQAQLTVPQKDLLKNLANQYAPKSLTDAAATADKALNSLGIDG